MVTALSTMELTKARAMMAGALGLRCGMARASKLRAARGRSHATHAGARRRSWPQPRRGKLPDR